MRYPMRKIWGIERQLPSRTRGIITDTSTAYDEIVHSPFSYVLLAMQLSTLPAALSARLAPAERLI